MDSPPTGGQLAWPSTAKRSGRGPDPARLLVATLLGLAAAGCSDFQKPLWDASDVRLLAIPFRDTTVRRDDWYLHSARGRAVVQYFKNWVEENYYSLLEEPDDHIELLEKIDRWVDATISREDWAELTSDAEFDAVLVGEITEFRFQQPRDTNYYRPSAEFRYRVIQCRTGRTLYRSDERRVDTSPRGEDQIPISYMDFEERKPFLERSLLRAMGARLGKDLYGYYSY